jgi:RNA polymerase sigma-70 factor (ECF subfamily)
MTAFEFHDQLIDLQPSLMKYAHRLRLGTADAQDLVQETFLKVLLNREKFVDKGYLKAWTYTIMKNTFINNYRRHVSRNSNAEITDSTLFINQKKAPSADNPDSVYSHMEITKSIEKMNKKLSIPFQMYIEGYKYKEIADTINIKLGTVKNRIYQARREMMDRLQ